MSAWETVMWDVARAGGFTAYLLLTLSVAVGLALTLHWQSARWPRLINSELHNFVTLLSLIFVGVHVLAVWVDPFTRFGWSEVFIPFVSHYRPLWMALGIVALYLGLAIGLSTWLRPLIGYAWWRRLHVFTLLSFALVMAHGLATGSDTRTWWGALIYAASAALIGFLLLVRLLSPATPRERAHPLWAAATAIVLAVGALWALSGPLQAGWNSNANNGQGSGSRIALAAASASGTPGATSAALAVPFSATLTGTLKQTGPDGSGIVRYHLTATFQDGAQGQVDLRMTGQASGGDGGNVTITSTSVTLGTSANPTLYQGQVTQLRASESGWSLSAALSAAQGGSTIVAQLALTFTGGGTAVQGSIQAR
ncbi:MAG: ferric reductase-like transmembrane domain-containing protein [Ktedonobacterales bacterium]